MFEALSINHGPIEFTTMPQIGTETRCTILGTACYKKMVGIEGSEISFTSVTLPILGGCPFLRHLRSHSEPKEFSFWTRTKSRTVFLVPQSGNYFLGMVLTQPFLVVIALALNIHAHNLELNSWVEKGLF